MRLRQDQYILLKFNYLKEEIDIPNLMLIHLNKLQQRITLGGIIYTHGFITTYMLIALKDMA